MEVVIRADAQQAADLTARLMAARLRAKPNIGLGLATGRTMGVDTILDARELLRLVTGSAKAAILARAIEGPITAMVSASALQLHANCKVVVDEDAARDLTGRDYYEWMFANGTWGVMGYPTPRANIYRAADQPRPGNYGGSGERSDNGSWIHRQDSLLGGGAVAGDGNGCIYTENWSNC